jgi:hypothetical protein
VRAILTKRELLVWRLMRILLRNYDTAGESMGRSRRDVLLSLADRMLRSYPNDENYYHLDQEIEGQGIWAVLSNDLEAAEKIGSIPKQLTLWSWDELEIESVPDLWLAVELSRHHHLFYLQDRDERNPLDRLPEDELEAAYWIWKLLPVELIPTCNLEILVDEATWRYHLRQQLSRKPSELRV